MKKLILLVILAASTFAPMSFADRCNTRPLNNLKFELIFLNDDKPIGRMNVIPRFVEVSQREQTIFVDVPRRSVPQRFLRSDGFRFVSRQRSPFELLSNAGTELRGSTVTNFFDTNGELTPRGKRITATLNLQPNEIGRVNVYSYFGVISSSCN